jgi:hypothetical protein
MPTVYRPSYMKRTVVLGFDTLVNPAKLAMTIATYNASGHRILVPNYNLLFCFTMPDSVDANSTLKLTDTEAIDFNYRTMPDLPPWHEYNLPRASRLLNYALDEKLITLFEDTNRDPKHIELLSSTQTLITADKELSDFIAINWWGAYTHREIDFVADFYNFGVQDASLCLANGWDYAINGSGLNFEFSKHPKLIELVKSGQITSLVANLSQNDPDFFKKLQDRPQYLLPVLEQMHAISKEAEEKKETIWYLPNAILDMASLGFYSHFKMLYKIIKRNL